MDKDNFSKGVHAYLRLIHLYLNNKDDPEYEVNDKRLTFFTRLSKANSLSALLYLTLKNTKVKIDKDKLDSLEASYAANIKKGIGFDKERKELYKHREKLMTNVEEKQDNIVLYKENMTVTDLANLLNVSTIEIIN